MVVCKALIVKAIFVSMKNSYNNSLGRLFRRACHKNYTSKDTESLLTIFYNFCTTINMNK